MFFFGNEEAYEKQYFELEIVVLELSCRLTYIYCFHAMPYMS
jgi:hypothetical protein